VRIDWLIAITLAPLIAAAESGQSFQFQLQPQDTQAQGANLDMSVSGAQLLEEDLSGAPGDKGSDCQGMLQQLDAMKHQPLRRNALWERYHAQCQSGLNASPAYVPPLPQ
jgi:hypothetical protein